MTDIATSTDAATPAPRTSDPRTPEMRNTYFEGDKCMLQLRNGDVIELKSFGDYAGVDFSGSILKGVRMVNSNFAGANFTDCVLSHSDFEGSTLNRAIFKDVEMEFTNFGYCTAEYAQFAAKEACRVAFQNARLDFTTFSGCLEFGTFENAKLFGCVFNAECDVAINFYNAAVIGCHFQKCDLDEDWNVTGLDASFTTFADCSFSKITFDGVNFEGAKFIDCMVSKYGTTARMEFSRCNMTHVQIVRCQWRYAYFFKCLMENAKFQNVFMPGSRFVDCQATDIHVNMSMFKAARFLACKLKNAQFLNSNLNEATFNLSKLEGAAFEATTMQSTKMGRSTLTDARFTKCTFHPHTQWPEGFDIPFEP
jgi:uncharacterized protein YjbI with pentapeptide repeats